MSALLECPKCGGENIGQYRMPTGPIWCEDCKFRVESKEHQNPFIAKMPFDAPTPGPGTPAYRLKFILDELAHLFPEVDKQFSMSSGPIELEYLKVITDLVVKSYKREN